MPANDVAVAEGIAVFSAARRNAGLRSPNLLEIRLPRIQDSRLRQDRHGLRRGGQVRGAAQVAGSARFAGLWARQSCRGSRALAVRVIRHGDGGTECGMELDGHAQLEVFHFRTYGTYFRSCEIA